MAQVPLSSLSAEPAQGAGPPRLAPEPAAQPFAAAAVCLRCGGSGRLRINDDSFRTCLDCLGQGVKPRFSSQHSTPLSAPLSKPLSSPLPSSQSSRQAEVPVDRIAQAPLRRP